MPNAEGVESTKVLELNPNHTVFAALKAAHAAGDTDKVAKYAELLYDQALLIAGLPIEDPVAYAQLVCGMGLQGQALFDHGNTDFPSRCRHRPYV